MFAIFFAHLSQRLIGELIVYPCSGVRRRHCCRRRFCCCQPFSNVFSSVTGPAGSVVEHPLRDREVVGSIPGRAIPKALKMVPVATLLGAQHYKASTGFSSPNEVSHD